ncbi:MAG: homoserine kinase [Anaerolineales bacterium]
MARLTDLVDADISAISDIYGLEITRYQPISGGDENSSFLLNAGGQDCVLTFFETRSFAEVENFALLLNHLAGHGYHTNRALPAVGGSYVSNIQGKPFILKTWIPGDTLRNTAQGDYVSIGKAIAQLHDIPAPDTLPREHPYGLRHMPEARDHQVDLEYEAWLADTIAFLQDGFPFALPHSLIHGDLFDDNIIYHKGQFQAIIDFGDACYYPRAYDLGSLLFGACMVNGKLDVTRATDVLYGYQRWSPLDSDEIDAIQFFAIYAGAAISAWHYIHNYLRKHPDTRLEKYKSVAVRTVHLFGLKPSDFVSLLN